MPITAQHVRETLDAYLANHPDEKDALSVLSEVLDKAGDSIASRKEYRGHVTAGAALLRPDGRVLTIEHRALRKWLLPGGHVEESDATLLGAALRELAEETGISPDQVEPDSGIRSTSTPTRSRPTRTRARTHTSTSTSGTSSGRPPTWSSCKRKRSWPTRGSSPTC
ncbi:NUDIX domain-containing protein [Streptomyces hygroscopicus]|uniref:NUDIX domain-containing protein n=1 Tax=Streptomyces hygroscopicus TaxID=1912 RepID=UPI0036911AC5